MTEIRALFVDNEDNLFEAFWHHLNIYWRSLYSHIRLEYDYLSTPDQAFDELEQSPAKYKIIFADLLFPPLGNPTASANEQEPRGLDLIEMASGKGLLVVAFSIGYTNKYPNLKEDAQAKGADLFKYKSDLTRGRAEDFRRLCNEIYDLLLQKKIITDSVKFSYIREPKIDYIVSEIGEQTLRALYKQVLRGQLQPDEIKATYLTPGLSGAFVLKMQAHQQNRPTANHLLKISRSKTGLLKEINNRPMHGIYSNKLIVNYLELENGKIPQVGEWFAIGAVFENDASSLRDWLEDPESERKVPAVLSSLFLNGGLSTGHSPDRVDPQSPIHTLMPSASRKARILNAIKEFDQVIQHPELGADANWRMKAEALSRFLIHDRILGVSANESTEECHISYCHGDLHSRNVLVTTGDTPIAIIIDAAEFGTYHWATDYVRLLVDFVLSIYDHGVSSYQWKNMNHWIELVNSVIKRQPLPARTSVDELPVVHEKDPSLSVRTAIDWMLDKLPEICPIVSTPEDLEKYGWELQLALAVELMRGAYRTDLTVPKRVLALESAYEALVAAEGSFRGYFKPT